MQQPIGKHSLQFQTTALPNSKTQQIKHKNTEHVYTVHSAFIHALEPHDHATGTLHNHIRTCHIISEATQTFTFEIIIAPQTKYY